LRIGLSTPIGSKAPLKAVLDYASNLKVSWLEIKLDKIGIIDKLNDSRAVRKLRSILESYDFTYSVHAPYIDVNLASLNPYLGKASEKAVEKSLILSYKINSRVVTVHPGRLPKDYPKEALPKAIENSVERLRHLNSVGEDLGICLSIENDHKTANRLIAGYPDQIREIIAKVGCKFTLDVGHANTLVDPINFVELLGSDIVIVHLHDNLGESDDHLGIGEGNIDFKRVIGSLLNHRYHGPLILEIYRQQEIEPSINRIREILKSWRNDDIITRKI